MRATIIENISQKTGWISFVLKDEGKIKANEEFKGVNVWDKFYQFLENFYMNLEEVKWVDCYCKLKGNLTSTQRKTRQKLKNTKGNLRI